MRGELPGWMVALAQSPSPGDPAVITTSFQAKEFQACAFSVPHATKHPRSKQSTFRLAVAS